MVFCILSSFFGIGSTRQANKGSQIVENIWRIAEEKNAILEHRF